MAETFEVEGRHPLRDFWVPEEHQGPQIQVPSDPDQVITRKRDDYVIVRVR